MRSFKGSNCAAYLVGRKGANTPKTLGLPRHHVTALFFFTELVNVRLHTVVLWPRQLWARFPVQIWAPCSNPGVRV